MALLDAGPHTVSVFPQVDATNWRGDPTSGPGGTPTVVAGCWVQPSSSTRQGQRQVEAGQRVEVDMELICRDAPLGPWSRVEWVDGGVTRRFSVVAGPRVRRYSGGTGHVSATLREER